MYSLGTARYPDKTEKGWEFCERESNFAHRQTGEIKLLVCIRVKPWRTLLLAYISGWQRERKRESKALRKGRGKRESAQNKPECEYERATPSTVILVALDNLALASARVHTHIHKHQRKSKREKSRRYIIQSVDKTNSERKPFPTLASWTRA